MGISKESLMAESLLEIITERTIRSFTTLLMSAQSNDIDEIEVSMTFFWLHCF